MQSLWSGCNRFVLDFEEIEKIPNKKMEIRKYPDREQTNRTAGSGRGDRP
jgi:hypothetical protein